MQFSAVTSVLIFLVTDVGLLSAEPMRGYAVCTRCHAAEVAAFERSPMGRSVGPPEAHGDGRVVHKLSGSTLTVKQSGGAMEHKLEEHGLTAKYPAAYSVGAGMVGYSFLVRVGEYLFQSPLSYYTQTKSWDLTPGYETERHLDFTHEITSGCLFCHTGSVNLIAGSTNRFAEPAFTGISCERCHGSSSEHLKNPVPGSIMNPAKLAASRRDSTCEQCHLEGDERVLNPGRDWWDFKAGETTESVFVTYLRKSDGGSGKLRAVSQSELLAQSQCARQSGGRLWCGSCHDPHGPAENRPKQVQQVCLSCHGTLFTTGRHQPAAECVSCHMPRLQSTNVAHSAVTDHSIPRLPRVQQPEKSDKKEVNAELRAWREPADATLIPRDLGLAYFDQATATKAVPDLQAAYRLLSQVPAKERMSDPSIEVDLGSVLLAQNRIPAAIELFTRAASQQTLNARYAYCLGTALVRSGDFGAAIKALNRSIQLDPSQPDAYLALAQYYKDRRHDAEAQEAIRQYLRFMPQNILLRLAD